MSAKMDLFFTKKKIYQQLKEICDWFSTHEKLKQSLHPEHTQMNESFYNMLLYIVPKNVNFRNQIACPIFLSYV